MRELMVLPVCFCAAHDGMHVHLPHMADSQYGLPIYVIPDMPPLTAPHRKRSEWAKATKAPRGRG